jgi:hypothetical protein
MKRRSALRLPRYTLAKPLKRGGWAYFFNVPMWARRAGCPINNEPLGTDYDDAVRRAETMLLPAFDAWRSGTDAEQSTVAAAGTLDWVFAEYRADRRFSKLDAGTRRLHERGFHLVGRHLLKDGRRFGQVRVAAINTAIVDQLYEKLLIVEEKDNDGNVVKRERRTTINHAMKTCRRAWNIAARRNPGKLPLVNPFAAMGLVSSDRVTPTATLNELHAFRAKAVEMGYPSLATAALVGWEWLQREEAIFASFEIVHYRPKEHPDAVCIKHPKTGEETWFPLFDPDDGSVLYPELMAELDIIKRDRIGGLMLRRDWGDRLPWPTFPEEGRVDLTHMSRIVKKIVRAAGLRDELTFTSFRHGGFTETGDAEMTDREIRAQGAHTTAKVLPRYVKRTLRQVASGAKKRRASRTKGGHLSE